MLTDFIKEIANTDWNSSFSTEIQTQSITALESGKILLFPQLPFQVLSHENKFLTSTITNFKTKNISFNRSTGLLRGAECKGQDHDDLKKMLQRFADHAENLIRNLFSPYIHALQIGRTSFRPVEISGRVSSYRKDDTRLHVDAFPATPNQGRRILRVFTNINPNGQARLWRVGEPYADVAKRFLPQVPRPWPGKSFLLKSLKLTKTYRTKYDHIMLQIHNRMKADLEYQKAVPQCEIGFVPGNTWIVQTDHVSHAAMSGQYMFEQTFYLPVDAMLNPELSPLRVLEKMMGNVLV
ncbi:MAG: Kdo hydroxylase family protein [Gammaproteobacteria bacterium]